MPAGAKAMHHCTHSVVVATAIVAALAAAPAARAEKATATTYLLVRPVAMAGAPSLAAPVLENVTFSGSVQGWELRASLWGWLELRPGVAGVADADVLTLSGPLLKDGRLVLGRQVVAGGAARWLLLDGARVFWELPAGFRVDAFTGLLPQPQFRFDRQAWAYGARVSWRAAPFTEAGLSYLNARQYGWTSTERLGADLYLGPWGGWQGSARAVFELRELRFAEVDLAADGPWGTFTYHFASPDLFVPRTSVLSVFAASSLHEAGGDVRWAWLGGGARAVLYPGNVFGGWLSARASWKGLGGELRRTWAPAPALGGWTALGWVARPLFSAIASGEAVADVLDRPVNGQIFAAAVRAAVAWRAHRDWEIAAMLEGSTGPYAVRALAGMVRVSWTAEWEP
jgi:hypothetical protein